MIIPEKKDLIEDADYISAISERVSTFENKCVNLLPFIVSILKSGNSFNVEAHRGTFFPDEPMGTYLTEWEVEQLAILFREKGYDVVFAKEHSNLEVTV